MEQVGPELTDQQRQAVLALLERWHQAREEGRPPSLEELCHGQPELAGEVARALRFMEQLEAVGRDEAPETVYPSGWQGGCADTQAVGHQAFPDLGPRYRVEAVLGQGGMGAVYRAHDDRLGRPVAIKVIRPDHLSAAMRARLDAEARAVARLDHPHIVKVHDVGEIEVPGQGGPAPYLSLEYVEGGTLGHRLQPGEALGIGAAVRLVALLARAVQHAHERGVVHRDLKPENVLIAAPTGLVGMDTEMGCPKITDFGLARQVEAEHRLTMQGAIMGTPAYMAPEQAEGRGDVGPPADVYALGALLYRLLTGCPPFEAADVFGLLHKTLNEPPQPPTKLNPEIPAELEGLCLECLGKKPEQRPTAGGLAHRLEALLAGPPRPPSGKPWPGGRWLVAGAACLCLALLAVLVVAFWPRGATSGAGDDGPPAPLKGSVDLSVWKRPSGAREGFKPKGRGGRLSSEGALPLREGDFLRIEVELNRPAFVYVVWLDASGNAVPVYPWLDSKWGSRPDDEKPTRLCQVPGGGRRQRGPAGQWPVGDRGGPDAGPGRAAVG